MPALRQYTTRIKSLKNTEKMTRTMKMVSASKLRKAQEAQVKAKFYAQRLTELIRRTSRYIEEDLHPLFVRRPIVKSILMLVVTSDRGLCGAFNNSINKKVLAWLAEHKSRYEKIDITCIGRRGYMFLKRFTNILKQYEHVTDKPTFPKASEIGEDLKNMFLNGAYDEVYLAYNVYQSPLSQKPTVEKLLPIEPSVISEKPEGPIPVGLFEPSVQEFQEFLVPRYLHFKVYYTLLENSAGEHGARMTAMDNASRNTSELIDHYTLLRNRLRQSAITKELIEIIAGVEALNRG